MKLKLVGIGVGVLLLALLLIHFVVAGSGTQAKVVSPVSPSNENVMSASNAVDLASLCSVQFTSPTADTTIPAYGPLKIQWSGTGGAGPGGTYPFYVDGPDQKWQGWGLGPTNTNELWGDAKDPSLTIYMESYPEGDFTVDVSAMSPDGTTSCDAELHFTKKTSWSPDEMKQRQHDDSGAAAGAPLKGIVVNPVGP